MKALTGLQHASLFTRVLLLGGMFELLYILICMLLPFSITHPVYSASDSIWLWIFVPAQSLVFKTSILSLRFTNPGTHFLLLSLVIISLSSIYLYLIRNTFHTTNNIPLTSRWLLVPIIGATIFGITLLFVPALFNNDANNYLYRGSGSLFPSRQLLAYLGYSSQISPCATSRRNPALCMEPARTDRTGRLWIQ